MSLKVSIIILNWNGWKDTIECLESLYQIDYPNYEVILIDNNSSDSSITKIREYCAGNIKVESPFLQYDSENKPINITEYTNNKLKSIDKLDENFQNLSCTKLTLIKNDRNYGFTEGNNIGIRFALDTLNSDYILLLNNDTVVDKEFLRKMVNIGNDNHEIGILGPAVYWYNNKNMIQSAGANLSFKTGKQYILGRNQIDSGQFNGILDVNYVSGCALLIKSKVIDKIGLLNGTYFLYWEEADWCIRARKNGFKVCCIPQAKIWHKESISANKVMDYYFTRNTFLFMKQYTNTSQFGIFILYFFGFRFWFKIGAYILYYKNINLLFCFFKGVKEGLFIQNKH